MASVNPIWTQETAPTSIEPGMHKNATPPSPDFLSVAPKPETAAQTSAARSPLQRSPAENTSSVRQLDTPPKNIAIVENTTYGSAGSGCKPATSIFAGINTASTSSEPGETSDRENRRAGLSQTPKTAVVSSRSPVRSRMSVFASPSRVHKSGSGLPEYRDSLYPKEISSEPQTPKGTDSTSPCKSQTPHVPYTVNLPSSSQSDTLPDTSKTPKTPKTPGIQTQAFLDETPSKFTVPGLQKRCAELYSQVLTMSTDLQHAERELLEKNKLVGDLAQKMANAEKILRMNEDEKRKESEMHAQEKRFFTNSIEELQRQNSRLSARVDQDQAFAESMALEHNEKYAKLHKSFKALQSNFELEQNSKALLIDQIEFLTKERDILLDSERHDIQQSHIPSPDTETEMEQNVQSAHLGSSKFHGLQTPEDAALDTRMSLAHQNSDENLLSRLQSQHATQSDSLHHNIHANLGSLDAVSEVVSVSDSGSEVESDSDGSVHGTHLLSSFAEISGVQGFDSSSPVKDQFSKVPAHANFASTKPDLHAHLDSDFHNMSPGFQFPSPNARQTHLTSQEGQTTRPFSPPNPDEKAKSLKRQSLPAQLKLNASFEDDFVLSPLKLTAQANSSYFDDSSVSASTRPNSIISKRYSGTRANHSRFNSHDILPIKVEFEQLNQQLRSASAPHKDNQLSPQLSSVAEGNPIEDADMAFMRLNGYSMPTKRDSLMTDSSKRSSFISDFNISSGDITKQEITKLKFELQSLKLHNEKLLSYIGFELQKQKKNIKKLSSKQNLRERPDKTKMAPKTIEYSDAKLIERSRDMLIHKKRVLRSVSINPGMTGQHTKRRVSSMLQPFVGLGGISVHAEDDDDFVFKSHFISSLNTEQLDEYDVCKHGNRFDSHATSLHQVHSGSLDLKSLKKHRSQTFARAGQRAILDSSGEEGFTSIDEDSEEDDDQLFLRDPDHAHDGYSGNAESNGEWESSSESTSGSDVNYGELGAFNQMKYLILGKEHVKKSKKTDKLADDGLKYKFLTIALGIVIVGIRLTSHPQQQLTGS